jgi:hypothetical protein
MDVPDIVLVLIIMVMIGAALIVAAMQRRRNHALRQRFVEEYNLYEYGPPEDRG